MFLKNRFNTTFFRSIQFRIGLVFTATFILLFIILSFIILFTIYTALIKDEVQFLYNRVVTFNAQYETEGIRQLYTRAKNENEKLPYMGYFLRFSDPTNKEIFFYIPPGWEDFDYTPLYKAVSSGDHQKMLNLKSKDNSQILITVILPLYDGSTLQCGVVSTVQHRLIVSVRKVLTRLLSILIIVAFVTGVFVMARSLKPLSELNGEIEEITKSGEISHRLTLRGTGDQIDNMGDKINKMLDRIEDLVDGLKGTLDNTAHDLRTPLTRLMGRAELALDGTEEEKVEALETCMEESRHILTMLNTLMDISAAEKGLIEVTEKPLLLNELIDQIHDLYSIIGEDRSIDFTYHCEGEITYRADRMRLNQALSNLVDNALKFTPPGGKVHMELLEKEGQVQISISDTGPGIPHEERKEIFKRLYRGEKSRTSPGMGLGLSLVKAVVKAHDGKIIIENNPLGGSIFTIILP